MDVNTILTATLEAYEIAKAKLMKLEAEYTTLAQEHNALVEENKKLKEGLKDVKPKPRSKKK